MLILSSWIPNKYDPSKLALSTNNGAANVDNESSRAPSNFIIIISRRQRRKIVILTLAVSYSTFCQPAALQSENNLTTVEQKKTNIRYQTRKESTLSRNFMSGMVKFEGIETVSSVCNQLAMVLDLMKIKNPMISILNNQLCSTFYQHTVWWNI